MSQQNKTTLQSNINTDIANNTSRAISAADIRDNLIDMSDSLLFNSGSQTFDGTLTATEFVGDGSGLTGVTGEWDGTLDGDATISGSLIASGSLVDFTNATAISGSTFSGSFVGNGSGLTGIDTDPFPYTGDASIDGNLDVTGSNINFIHDTLATNIPTFTLSSTDGNPGFTIDSQTSIQQIDLYSSQDIYIEGGRGSGASSFLDLQFGSPRLSGYALTVDGTNSLNLSSPSTTIQGNTTLNLQSPTTTIGTNSSSTTNINGALNLATAAEVDFTNATAISGSTFSGSFVGDGSGLTGLPSSNPFPYTGDASFVGDTSMTGSLIASGSVVDFTDATAISGSTFSGSFVGDGSGLTGITSTPFPYTGNASIDGDLEITGENIDFTSNLTTNTPIFTLKSSLGDPSIVINSSNSQQIDIASTRAIFIEGGKSTGSPATIDLNYRGLDISSTDSTVSGTSTLELTSPSITVGTNASSTTTMNGVFTTDEYTVSTLPSSPARGSRAHVTDATATTFYSTVIGGGSNVVPVFYNGTNWVIA